MLGASPVIKATALNEMVWGVGGVGRAQEGVWEGDACILGPPQCEGSRLGGLRGTALLEKAGPRRRSLPRGGSGARATRREGAGVRRRRGSRGREGRGASRSVCGVRAHVWGCEGACEGTRVWQCMGVHACVRMQRVRAGCSPEAWQGGRGGGRVQATLSRSSGRRGGGLLCPRGELGPAYTEGEAHPCFGTRAAGVERRGC